MKYLVIFTPLILITLYFAISKESNLDQEKQTKEVKIANLNKENTHSEKIDEVIVSDPDEKHEIKDVNIENEDIKEIAKLIQSTENYEKNEETEILIESLSDLKLVRKITKESHVTKIELNNFQRYQNLTKIRTLFSQEFRIATQTERFLLLTKDNLTISALIIGEDEVRFDENINKSDLNKLSLTIEIFK